jgi:hypothetical protein
MRALVNIAKHSEIVNLVFGPHDLETPSTASINERYIEKHVFFYSFVNQNTNTI